MGASQSSPQPASTKHVFTADTPINFSAELIDSLQASTETNSTRAKTLDLHIAERVAAELEKLQAKSKSEFDAVRSKVVAAGEEVAETAESLKDKAKAKLPSVNIPGVVNTEQKEEDNKSKTPTSQKVADEIERLKKTLGQRKVLKELPKDVEAAREGVISCLRVNDRRPLDCWKEVEIFKLEVKKMQEQLVEKTL